MPHADSSKGHLLVIGGREDWDNDRAILNELRSLLDGGSLAVCTAASGEPSSLWRRYRSVFRDIGVTDTVHLDLRSRSEANASRCLEVLADARGVFFTGGSQARLMQTLGDTDAAERVRSLYKAGGVIAGTSAGAAAVGELNVTHGPGHRSARVEEVSRLRLGLSLMPGTIIDQHFAERGRLGRLVGALGQRPDMLGIGIDENTAFVVDGETQMMRVVGDGAVYTIDAREARCNLESDCGSALSLHDARLSVLAAGDRFDLAERLPVTAAVSSR